MRTYIERDVRRILKVTDLLTFQTFLKLCAGRAGHITNLAGLAADCGMTHPTAKAWMSELEASFIVFRSPAFQSELGEAAREGAEAVPPRHGAPVLAARHP